MKNFNLTEARAGAKIITKTYQPARLIGFDEVTKTVYAIVGTEPTARHYNEQGIEFARDNSAANDLFMLEPTVDLFEQFGSRFKDFIGTVAANGAAASAVVDTALDELRKIRVSLFGSVEETPYRIGSEWVFTHASNIVEYSGTIADIARDRYGNVIALRVDWHKPVLACRTFGAEWNRLGGEICPVREYKEGEMLYAAGR